MSKKLFLILILPVLALVGGYLIRQAFATSNPHTWTNGLVGYWSFDGQFTTSTAGTRDVSNTGNWGAFNGGVKPVAGISGQALSFDGVDDYVNAGTGISLHFGTNPHTVTAWIKRETTANDKAIVSKRSAGVDYDYFVAGATGKMGSFNGSGSVFGNTVVNTGVWHYLTWVYDSGTIYFYLDGKGDGSVSQTSGAGNTSSVLWIGFNSAKYFNGLIDEVRIYNRALSADEVKQHYDQTRRNFVVNNPSGTPPVAWWKMDEATGATVRDYSVNANNGTVSNGGYGVTSTDGKIGKALSFDGTDDYVNITNALTSLSNTTAGTWEAWIKPNTFGKSAITFGDTSANEMIDLQIASNQTLLGQLNVAGTNRWQLYTSNAVFSAGVWAHIVLVQNGISPVLYVNGIVPAQSFTLQSDKTVWFAGASGIDNGRIGSRNTSGAGDGNFFNGLIDDVRIYNYARTADQIAADYRAGAYRTIVGTSVPSTWWTDGLVGYWNFDGQNTTTTSGALAGTRDVSNNGNWGAFSGGVKPVGGIVGQALNFDGVDDYVGLGQPSNLNFNPASNQFTIELWIKTTTSGTLIAKARSSTSERQYHVFLLNGTLAFYIGTTGYRDTGKLVNDGAWHHIVVRNYSDGGLKAQGYVDGVAVGTPLTSGSNTVADTDVLIGTRRNNDNTDYASVTMFNGLIDEVRIYSRALGADEVMQHYQQTRRNLGI